MGRPLAKRFFGNRNVGTSGTADNGIGGEGLATIANPAQLGSILVCSTATSVPVLTIPAPALPGGVLATADVEWEVESVYVTNGLSGNGYAITTGTTVLTGLGHGATFSITAVGSGQGEVQTIVPANRGSFTTIPVVADTYQIEGGDGNNQAHVKYRVKSITVTEKGSGYTSAPSITWVTTGVKGTNPGTTTSALTTDSGATNNTGNASTNQENAIIIRAKTTSGGTAKVGDIKAQKGSHRYKVKTADGTAVCKLVTTTSVAVNQAYILATDITGNEYYVTKITSRKCIVVQKSGGSNYEFADPTLYPAGQIVKWTFGTQVLNTSVQIENA
jgi:hypothetical protein